jgi:multidrug efflux pump subunit AcrB
MFDTENSTVSGTTMKTLNDLPMLDDEVVADNQEAEQAPTERAAQSRQHDTEHWASLRAKAERAERAERERDELMRKMQELEYARLQQQQPQVNDEEEVGIAPDALAEGKHLARMYKKVRELENKFKNYQQQTSHTLMENQLKAQYPDFYSVVSEENLAELKRSHPAIAQTLANAAGSDAYSAAASAYSIIRELGIARATQESNQNRELLHRNASKPRSAQAASPQRGDSPLSQANGFVVDGKATREYQDQLLKEMHAAIRQPRS